MKIKILKIIKYLVISLILLFIILALYTRFFPNSSGLFGFKAFTIVTGSMKPELQVGDIIIVKKTDYNKILPGDIVAYNGMTSDTKGKIITHKVEMVMTEANRYIYYTKGTANTSFDSAVYQEQICGVLFYKPFILSLISRALNTIIGFILIVLLPFSLMFLFEFKEISRLVKKRNILKRSEENNEVQVTQEESKKDL